MRPDSVIPASSSVIPAEAGIQEWGEGRRVHAATPSRQDSGPRSGSGTGFRGKDGLGTSPPVRVGGAGRVAAVVRRAAARLRDAGTATPRLDAELLLMEALGWSREDLYRSPGTELRDSQAERFESLLSRRVQGEPVAYIAESREFWSLDFRVTPDVLIPRPETEHLVETVADFLASRRGPCRVLEIGTGSGAIAVCVAREWPDAEVWATDVSAPALDVARENASRHGVGGRIHWLRGDLLAPVQGLLDWFDVLVSNPPYISSGEIGRLQRDVRDWEPALALDGGADGMDFYRRLARDGVRHLRKGGLLAVEVGAEQGGGVSELFLAQAGLRRTRVRRDYAGFPRVVAAERIAV